MRPRGSGRGVRVPWWRSLRLGICLAVAAVALVVSGVVGVVLAQRSAEAATTSLRDEAISRLSVVSDGYGLDGRLRSGASLNPPSLPAPLQTQLADTTGHDRATYYDGRLMWAAGRLGPGVVIAVALDARSLATQDHERLQTLAWVTVGALLASLLLGWWAGSTLSRRLRSAADAAEGIAAGDGSARASQRGHDEVAVLTRTIDDMADALRRRIESEQDFTADVAHELRTPLTGLVSATELLPEGEAEDLVRVQVVRLRRLVEDLLEVSRLDRGAEPARLEEVDLGAAVRDSLARVGAPEGTSVDLAVTRSEQVMLEPRRLDRILGNLVVNLGRHGGGRGHVVVDGVAVEVTDEGPGYPADLLEHGPRRFHATGATKGSGLGLTIVEKQAASMGASVALDRAQGGGASTRITFAGGEASGR